MGALKQYFAAIGRAVTSLGDGLTVTASYLLRKPVTIQYPDRIEKPVSVLVPERSRGFLEVDLDICTACAMCDKSCPIDCITVETGKDPATGARMLTRLDIDLGKCMFCGLCAEACPNGSIRHSHEFEGGTCCVKNLVVHFVDKPRLPAKPLKKGESPPQKPLGSIIRRVMPEAWAKPSPAGKPAAVEATPPPPAAASSQESPACQEPQP